MHRHEDALYQKIKIWLKDEIASMKGGENRLDPEEKLAARFGTSRATIREALSELAQKGYLTSWQGRGNFGHPHATALRMRFDITSDFYNLLGGAEKDVHIDQSRISLGTPSDRLIESLPIWKGEDVFHFDWIYGAGGEPLIICKVQVLSSQMKYVLEHRKNEMCLSEYLKQYHRGDIIYTTTWFHAVQDPGISVQFGVEPETPMIMWEEFFYDLLDQQVCYNQVYFHPRETKLSMLLRTI